MSNSTNNNQNSQDLLPFHINEQVYKTNHFLHYACAMNRIDDHTERQLLESNPIQLLKSYDDYGFSPLYYAGKYGYEETMRILMKYCNLDVFAMDIESKIKEYCILDLLCQKFRSDQDSFLRKLEIISEKWMELDPDARQFPNRVVSKIIFLTNDQKNEDTKARLLLKGGIMKKKMNQLFVSKSNIVMLMVMCMYKLQ